MGEYDKRQRKIARFINKTYRCFKNVTKNCPIWIIKISQITGQPQHMIMYSIRTIEKDGIITPSYLAEILTVMVNEVIGTLVSIMDEMATAVRNLKKI